MSIESVIYGARWRGYDDATRQSRSPPGQQLFVPSSDGTKRVRGGLFDRRNIAVRGSAAPAHITDRDPACLVSGDEGALVAGFGSKSLQLGDGPFPLHTPEHLDVRIRRPACEKSTAPRKRQVGPRMQEQCNGRAQSARNVECSERTASVARRRPIPRLGGAAEMTDEVRVVPACLRFPVVLWFGTEGVVWHRARGYGACVEPAMLCVWVAHRTRVPGTRWFLAVYCMG